MSFGRNNSDDCQIVSLVYSFDFAAVESVTGFDKQEVMAVINEYDKKMDSLGLADLIDITFVLAEAIVNTVTNISDHGKRDYVTADYYAILSDMVSDDEDRFENLDDTLMAGWKLCYRLHNFLVIGFTAHLDYEERSYLASIISSNYLYEETIRSIGSLTVTDDDVIIFAAAIPRELDEDEDAIQQLHTNILARINRNLSRSTQRSRRD